MATVRVRVELDGVETKEQRTGPGPDYMRGRIRCRITWPEGSIDTYAEVKQVTGTSYSHDDNIEVDRPVGYKGPFDFNQFAPVAIEHYRRALRPLTNGTGSEFSIVDSFFPSEPTVIEMDCDVGAAGW
jgi:hypothetical protein